MHLKIPKFKDIEEKFKFLKKNEKILIAQKRAKMKKAKPFFNHPVLSVAKCKKESKSVKENNSKEGKYVEVVAVISTTNVMDSHKDVHLDGWAKKSLKESKNIMHVQEHKMNEFSKIISEGNDLNVYTKQFKWVELGFEFKGSTEALIFESKVRRERNPEMYRNYSKNWVNNHSVGMVYTKIFLAMDSEKEEDKEHKALFDKHIGSIANKEEVIKNGYFWGVVEAKVIEGSSVPAGSNFATPTLSNNKTTKKPNKNKKTLKMKALYKFLQVK